MTWPEGFEGRSGRVSGWLRASSGALAPRIEFSLIAAITLAGAFFRFFHLDARSLWLDEAITAQVIGLHDVNEVVAWVQAWVDQTPLFFLVTWMLGHFGDSEAVLRLPSALAGTATIPVIYLLARQLFGIQVGVFSAALMAMLPFAVWYSQDARPYSLLMLTTVAQMLFAYRVVAVGRRRDWIGLGAMSVANLYTHLVAIAATLSVVIFVVVGIARAKRLRWKPAVLTALGVSLSYALWLPTVQVFIDRKDVGFGRYDASHIVSLDEVWSLLSAFDFTGLILGLFALGAVVAVFRACQGRLLESGLLAIWLVIPIVTLALRLRGGLSELSPRYLSFLLPAAVIIVALGLELIARMLQIILNRLGCYGAPWTVLTSSTVLIMILIQLAPPLVQSYDRGKDDYRGAAQYVMSHGVRDSVVLALGEHSNFAVLGLGYYMRRMRTQVAVVDGALLDGNIISRLHQDHGPVWGVFVYPSPAEQSLMATSGLRLRHFLNIVLVDFVGVQSAIEQTALLLNWAVRVQPQLLSSIELIRLFGGDRKVGPNLLPAPLTASHAYGEGRWYLSPGTAVAGASFHLMPRGGDTNVIYRTRLVTAGRIYVISFEFINDQLVGWQHVYVSTHDSADVWLQVFPTGAGYDCRPAHGWSTGIFAFTIPEQASSLTVWLRAHGTGQSEFRNVHLAPILISGRDQGSPSQQE